MSGKPWKSTCQWWFGRGEAMGDGYAVGGKVLFLWRVPELDFGAKFAADKGRVGPVQCRHVPCERGHFETQRFVDKVWPEAGESAREKRKPWWIGSVPKSGVGCR